ncbi:hypothetical protein [Bacillus suaedae]|uniref:Uncharacterized protein n=1 Tax=Halalkalibacter suaedae TaxID=2822140 RepID=A0A940WR34_9BACI|nr:hypothetical protein [Bacillus suaedae]MBP3950960.1 hypothetical protein [Bacillus suaedae]
MDKEKFHIPMPDEQTIQRQIDDIVHETSARNLSFFSLLKEMYEQIGLKHLLSDRSEMVFILISIVVLFGIFLFKPDMNDYDLYGYLFFVSPVLFVTLSLYSYLNKVMNGTMEVEMTCKYHVYQIIVFRMLVFSVLSILFNAFTILLMSLIYKDIEFVRAFMISNTGLFLFSILFLFVISKRASAVVVGGMMTVWTVGNLLLLNSGHVLYRELLLTMPLIIYVFVLVGVVAFYLVSVKHFIRYQPVEGAY